MPALRKSRSWALTRATNSLVPGGPPASIGQEARGSATDAPALTRLRLSRALGNSRNMSPPEDSRNTYKNPSRLLCTWNSSRSLPTRTSGRATTVLTSKPGLAPATMLPSERLGLNTGAGAGAGGGTGARAPLEAGTAAGAWATEVGLVVPGAGAGAAPGASACWPCHHQPAPPSTSASTARPANSGVRFGEADGTAGGEDGFCPALPATPVPARRAANTGAAATTAAAPASVRPSARRPSAARSAGMDWSRSCGRTARPASTAARVCWLKRWPSASCEASGW